MEAGDWNIKQLICWFGAEYGFLGIISSVKSTVFTPDNRINTNTRTRIFETSVRLCSGFFFNDYVTVIDSVSLAIQSIVLITLGHHNQVLHCGHMHLHCSVRD